MSVAISIAVCESNFYSINDKITAMGYRCSMTKPDKYSIMETILIDKHDILIIDELQMEKSELEQAVELLSGMEKAPLCIIITSNTERFRDFSFVVCLKFFPTKREIDKLFNEFRHKRIDMTRYYNSHYSKRNNYDSNENILEREVTEIIQKIGIPANVKGYRYLRNAVMLATSDMTILDSVTKELYPTVAINNQTTPTRVERAIRHAISAAWDRQNGDIEYIEKTLHCKISYVGGRPTNSELIALISDSLRVVSRR